MYYRSPICSTDTNKKINLYFMTVFLTISLLSAGPAFSEPVGQKLTPIASCSGNIEINYSPGLTNTPTETHVSYRADLSSCLHLINVPLMNYGVYQGTLVGERSCSSLFAEGHVPEEKIRWASGEKTHFSYDFTTTYSEGNLTVTLRGAVIAGLYTGKSVYGIEVLTPFVGGDSVDLEAGCDTEEGITSISGPVIFEIF